MKLTNGKKAIIFFALATVFLTITGLFPSANWWFFAVPLGNEFGITPIDVIIYFSLFLGVVHLSKWTMSVVRIKKNSHVKKVSSVVSLFVVIIAILIFTGWSFIETYYRSSQIKYQETNNY